MTRLLASEAPHHNRPKTIKNFDVDAIDRATKNASKALILQKVRNAKAKRLLVPSDKVSRQNATAESESDGIYASQRLKKSVAGSCQFAFPEFIFGHHHFTEAGPNCLLRQHQNWLKHVQHIFLDAVYVSLLI